MALEATAKNFCHADSIDDMARALQQLQACSSKIQVLGGGTNLILAPQIGSVIHCSDSSWKITKRKSEHVWIECNMGHDFTAFVDKVPPTPVLWY